jgi:hypothetical protein
MLPGFQLSPSGEYIELGRREFSFNQLLGVDYLLTNGQKFDSL